MSADLSPVPEQTFYGRPIWPMAGGAIDTPPAAAGTDGNPAQEFTTDTADPLVALGLVDPKTGVALPTQDWTPEADAGAGAAGAPGVAPTQPASLPSGTSQWDSPENPYRQEVERLKSGPDPVIAGQQYLANQQARINADAASAYSALVTDQKMDPAQAQVLVRAAAQAALVKASQDAEHIALGPVVRRHVAEDIARKYSGNGVQINPQDLMASDLNGPDAMEAVARRLQAGQRDARSSTRSASGPGRKPADSAEGGAGAGSQFDYSKLSPQQAISLGLRRGQ